MDFSKQLPQGFKPMLAAKTDDEKLKEFFDKGGTGYASVKLDGIRCVVSGGVGYSRSGIPLPSKAIQAEFASGEYDGFDGEIIVGYPNAYDVYRKTDSMVMSENKNEPWKFYAFDYLHGTSEKGFEERCLHESWVANDKREKLICVTQTKINSYAELTEFEAEALEMGYEGAMFRKRDGGYKLGRSTAREMHLMKLKRMESMELEVVRFEQAMHNANPAEMDAFGRTKRSSHKENLVPLERVGKFVVMYQDLELNVSPGKFTHKELEHIWLNQSEFLGKLLKFDYFAHGMKDLPRHPVAIGWRDKRDT